MTNKLSRHARMHTYAYTYTHTCACQSHEKLHFKHLKTKSTHLELGIHAVKQSSLGTCAEPESTNIDALKKGSDCRNGACAFVTQELIPLPPMNPRALNTNGNEVTGHQSTNQSCSERPKPNPWSWRCRDIAAMRPHAEGRKVEKLRRRGPADGGRGGNLDTGHSSAPPNTARVAETIPAEPTGKLEHELEHPPCP